MAGMAAAGSLADSLLVTGSSFNRRRARLMNKPTRGETSVNLKGPVLYWMSRDQRVQGIIGYYIIYGILCKMIMCKCQLNYFIIFC